jgi:HPt (histidine-containing phosphotransfer) domain-containing protein
MSTTLKPIFDMAFFNDITDGDKDFQSELTEVFVSSVSDQLLDIKKVSEEQKSNPYKWHSVLHSLKGSCSSIGAIKLSDFIISKQNKNINFTREEKIKIYKKIETLLEETKSELLKNVT